MSMFSKVIMLSLIISLGGCARIAGYRSTAAEASSEAADQTLDHHVWGVCKASTAGALERRYGHDPEGAAAWLVFCSVDTAPVPVPTQ